MEKVACMDTECQQLVWGRIIKSQLLSSLSLASSAEEEQERKEEHGCERYGSYHLELPQVI